MRSRRRLAVVPFVLLALGACSDGTTPEPQDDAPDMGAPTIEGRGDTELPTPDDQQAVLEDSGDATSAVTALLAAGASESGQVTGAQAGSHLLRVVCTSSDGAPVTVTVTAGESELTSYQAACVPMFQGGATMADSDAFEVPAGDVAISVTAAAESSVAVGLVPAG